MTALDRTLATPRLVEIDHVDVASPPREVWEIVRHFDLARSPLIRALFALRALPGRLLGRTAAEDDARARLCIDDLVSTPARPGFQILVDEPPREVVVGAIGKVWEGEIPFVHVSTAEAFAAFAQPDFAKVAWALRALPLGERDTRVEIEVRVDATDDEAWGKFRRYFRFIGLGSHLIRHVVLASLQHQLGTPAAREAERRLDGDELLPDAIAQDTRGITIAATPDAIWPWLLQMGAGRGGFYSVDLVDNGASRSARELHPELADIAVGDVLPATPGGEDGGFEVLRIVPGRCLALGGLYDPAAGQQLPFTAARPTSFWQVTWCFVLERLDATTTRLHVRARAAFSPDERLHAAWIRPIHRLMEGAQLRHLAERAEGRLDRDDWRDVVSGVGGAAIMVAAFLTSFLRSARSHWGVDAREAARAHLGDHLVPVPRWSWTHAIEIGAPAETVWPWVAQIGADRGGFYSYQWLENLAGCQVRNAERVHDEWQVREGDALRLHPRQPPLCVVRVVPGRAFLAHGAPDETARAQGRPWAAVTWLFVVEPLGTNRCRLVSRYRCATSDDVASRIALGPTLIEPIGFAMDRRMLLGIKERAERSHQPLRHVEHAPLTGPQKEDVDATT